MFGYSPARIRDTAVAMDSLDAWPGTPPFRARRAAEPSLELGTAGAHRPDAAGGLLGEIDLASTPAAVRPARSYIRALVVECCEASATLLDDLELLTSEAVTNCVVHALPRPDGTVRLRALRTGPYVRVEVTDGGSLPGGRPGGGGHRGTGDAPAVSGRGLYLIQALARDYGTYHDTGGTTTFWFRVAVDGIR
ncbi:ATP-binding protein [Spirillospora sp. NPDC029432]|uniref:ATP-binding protein n=1 Tax=Spirillospora sp. NPDC029432 TaxID=3154599 RepID=UPI003451859B